MSAAEPDASNAGAGVVYKACEMSNSATRATGIAAERADRLRRVRANMREIGVAALLVADDDDFSRREGGNVRFLSGAAVPMPMGGGVKLVVVLPLESEPTLVVPSIGFNSLPGIMRRRSWLGRVVSAPTAPFLEKARVMMSGISLVQQTADLVAAAVADAGAAAARIGVCGEFPGLEETKARLPSGRFAPAWIEDDAGVKRDPVEFERSRTKSRWEIAQMESAQTAAEAGAVAFATALADGATYNQVQAEVEYRMRLAGAEEVFVPGSRGRDPLGTYSLPSWIEGEYRDGDMIMFEMNARVSGYWAQLPRTWVVGKPTDRQMRLHDAALKGFEAMRSRLEVGITGEELWEFGFAKVDAAGFEPVSRFGHGIGLSQAEWSSVFPGDKARVQEGQSVVLHASAIDPATGDEALIGEQFILEDGHPRLLSRSDSPVTLDLAP